MARLKSFSAEKRVKQNKQGFFALACLVVVIILGFAWKTIAPYCWGALQGGWPPLLIIALRYGYRVVSGRRYDLIAVVQAVAFLMVMIMIPIYLFPKDVWHALIILLCLVSTVIGIKHFRFTPLFMLVNCLIAGAILLNF